MKINRYLLTVVILTLLFFAPFLIKPRILTLKDNDLGRTYIPMLQFAKDSIIQDKTIPLWRPDQMMGEPLIGNAIFPVIYPLNLILIFLPANSGLKEIIFSTNKLISLSKNFILNYIALKYIFAII